MELKSLGMFMVCKSGFRRATTNEPEGDASVDIGEVNARVYGADKGGFFRVFRKENAGGEYRLHAHVTTGQIDLLGKNAHVAGESQ